MSLTDHISVRTFKATRCKRCGIVIGFGDRCDWCQHRPTGHVDAPGEYQGRHHSEWIGTVQAPVAAVGEPDDDPTALAAGRLERSNRDVVGEAHARRPGCRERRVWLLTGYARQRAARA